MLELGSNDLLRVGEKTFRVAVLESRDQRTEGLLNACNLHEDEGALFVMPSARDWSFHTQGMTQHIEIAFLDPDFRVLAWRDAPPGLSDLRANGKAKYVLEVAPGTRAALGGAADSSLTVHLSSRSARSFCEPIVDDAWQCPLPPASGGLATTISQSGFVDLRSHKTTCASRVAACVLASERFRDELVSQQFHDWTPASRSANGWRKKDYVPRPWQGADAYDALKAAAAVASGLQLQPATSGQELKSRFYGSHAFTGLHQNPVSLVSWWIDQATVAQLATTLVHEWMHVAHFADPKATGDRRSVVYGSEAIVEALAQEVLAQAHRR